MMIKAVLLFLVVMLLLGMFGKWRLPKIAPRKRGTAIEPARKCSLCGAYIVGSTPEPCARSDCPAR